MLWTLAFSGGVSLVAAAAYVLAGTRFLAPGHAADRRAARAFAAWWFGIALYTGVQGAEDLMGAADAIVPGLFVALRFATLVLICAAFAGLTHYVLFVRTGDARWAARAWAYYGALALAFVVLVALGHPHDVVIQRWRTDVDYGASVPVPLLAAAVLLAAGPALAASVAYLRFASRADDPAQRRRILVIGWGLVLWLVGTAVSRASQDDAFQLVARPVLGAGVALAIAAVLRPPRALPPPTKDRAAMRARIRELV